MRGSEAPQLLCDHVTALMQAVGVGRQAIRQAVNEERAAIGIGKDALYGFVRRRGGRSIQQAPDEVRAVSG